MAEFAWASLSALRARTSFKWRAYPPDVLPLWVAEMDVDLAPAVREAVTRAIDAGDTGYSTGTAYAEALATFAAGRWGWTDLPIERTAVVPDVMVGVVELLRLLTAPGDAVVVCPPVYSPFFTFVVHADRRIVEAPLGPDGRLDVAALDRAFEVAAAGARSAVFLLSNPHNPTGAVATAAELASVAQLARHHGVRVISDEIHGPLVFPGSTFTPFLTVPGAEDGFALHSASKAWNLAGLKAALAIAGPESGGDLARMPEEVRHGVSHVGEIAHAASFLAAVGWLDELMTALDANRSLLTGLLAEHLAAVRYAPPEGTYFAWLDCADLGLEPAPDVPDLAVVTEIAGPARFFVDEARVALSSGHIFGTGGGAHARLNFATSPAILTEAVSRMGEAVARRRVSPGDR